MSRCSSCAGSRIASRKSMKPSGPPTSSGGQRLAPSTKAGYGLAGFRGQHHGVLRFRRELDPAQYCKGEILRRERRVPGQIGTGGCQSNSVATITAPASPHAAPPRTWLRSACS